MENFVEVNLVPLENDSAFAVEMLVLDTAMHSTPFKIWLNFSLGEDSIPGLKADAENRPEKLFNLAKDLLLCDNGQIPELYEIPPEDCPQDGTGFYYELEMEMELSDETTGYTEVREQYWQVDIVYKKIEKMPEPAVLFQMIQNFFKNYI
ncbi:MAG: hypothetical protein RMM17_02770 [Acidobacteriota bacterium]|nr:hypothetical protein [Blastocatellia bacterium]MDW8411590.1 hypothetical protein [Acidobacteriota bacterium]